MQAICCAVYNFVGLGTNSAESPPLACQQISNYESPMETPLRSANRAPLAQRASRLADYLQESGMLNPNISRSREELVWIAIEMLDVADGVATLEK